MSLEKGTEQVSLKCQDAGGEAAYSSLAKWLYLLEDGNACEMSRRGTVRE